jgi:peptidoglycan/xylan/chitin deacetylase (PgdA/CDA1 family)
MHTESILIALFLAAPTLLPAQSPPNAFRWPDGKRVAVSFSFDDARASQVDTGIPLLDKYGVKATFFVNPPNLKKRLDGWKKAAASGQEIGNHTNSHPCTVNYPFSSKNALEDYSIARIDEEMDGATRDIEQLLGVKPVTFAYPCGQKFVGRGTGVKSYVPEVARRFLAGRGWLDEGSNDPVRCDLAQLVAIMSDGLTFEEMKDQASTAAAQGGWLVFAGHEIGNGGRQTTRAADLEQFIRYASDPANGIWLNTVRAVAEYVQARRNAHP